MAGGDGLHLALLITIKLSALNLRRLGMLHRNSSTTQRLPAEFDLPAPPSANNLFHNGGDRGGRIKSPGYRAWIKEAGWERRLSRPAKIKGTVAVSVTLGMGCRRPDVDNCLKALLDLLVAHEVIEDDAQVVELSVRVDRYVPAGRAHILVNTPSASSHEPRRPGQAFG